MDDAPPPKASVLLPVRDGARWLGPCLESLAAQHLARFEVLAVDDGSRDGTRALLDAFAARDPRFRVLGQPPLGIVAALRRAAAQARAPYLARMDADDLADPRRLALQVAALDADPRLGLAGCGVEIIGDGVRSGRLEYAAWLNALRAHEEIERDLFIECPIAHPAFMARRDAFEAVGGYRDFDGPEDYDLVLRLWRAGWRLANLPEVLIRWRERPDRLSRVDARYAPEAFRRLKREALRATLLPPGRPFRQWGAGAVGKRWLREWGGDGPRAVVDVDPRKIGSRIHGVPVIAPDALDPRAAFTVVAVGAPGARALIREWMAERGALELRDFVLLA